MVSHGHAQRNEFNVYITRFTARVNNAIRWHAFSGSIRSTHKTPHGTGGVLNTRSLEAAGFYLNLLFSSRALSFWLVHVYGRINTLQAAQLNHRKPMRPDIFTDCVSAMLGIFASCKGLWTPAVDLVSAYTLIPIKSLVSTFGGNSGNIIFYM